MGHAEDSLLRGSAAHSTEAVSPEPAAQPVLTGAMHVQKSLPGTQWRTGTGATLQGFALRPGSLPTWLLAAGMRQAHLVTPLCEVKASFPLGVSLAPSMQHLVQPQSPAPCLHILVLAGACPLLQTAPLLSACTAEKLGHQCHGEPGLSAAEVQDEPVLPLQAADFSGDGLTDIVLISHRGVYGYQQVRKEARLSMQAACCASV